VTRGFFLKPETHGQVRGQNGHEKKNVGFFARKRLRKGKAAGWLTGERSSRGVGVGEQLLV